MSIREGFWHRYPLDELSKEEWEALCDGCGKCCLHKLEDEDSGEVYYTKISCQYSDADSCQCTVYEDRNDLVPNCVWLRPEDVGEFHWLPKTCAYRLIGEGKPLYDWHPLISQDSNSVHRAGVSIKGRTLSEIYVHPEGMEEHIIKWVE